MMARVIVPPSEYDTEFIPGNTKAAVRNAGAHQEPLLMVPIDSLVVDPLFNVRVQNRTHEEQISSIALSIETNGFYKHKALPGYCGKHNGLDAIFITGGFSRLEAAKLARSRGVPIESVPVIIRHSGTNTADLILGLANDNTGIPLSPYELAIVCKRLKSLGWSERKIAEGIGKSQPWVNTLLGLLELPQELQGLITSERVTATHVLKAVKNVGVIQALNFIKADLVLADPDAGPIGDDDTGTTGLPSIRNKTTRISSKVALAAVDHTIETRDIDFLVSWRAGNEDAVATVNESLKRRKPNESRPEGDSS